VPFFSLKMRTWILCAGVFLSTRCALGQDTTGAGKNEAPAFDIAEKLQSAAGKFQREPTKLINVFHFALYYAGLSGGLELAGPCGIDGKTIIPNTDWSPRDALDAVVKSRQKELST
jgi:hypothetical protein